MKQADEEEKLAGARPAAQSRARRLGRPGEIASMALINDATRKKYHEVYKDIYKDGLIDRRTKELIAIGVASVTGCQGCLMGHIRKARALGVGLEEIKEVVGIAFTVNAATVVDHTDVVAALLGIGQADGNPNAAEPDL